MIEKRTRTGFKSSKKDKKIKRRCKFCSIEFVTYKRSNQQICSKRCPARVFRYNCLVCNKSSVQAVCWGEGRFCTERCRQAWYYSQGVLDLLPAGMHLPVNPKRRAKILCGDPIDKRSVYEFYGYICIVCQDHIDPALAWPDPMSASLEHVVPLSEGGTHTWDNVAPAHLLCNTKKDNTIESDLIDRFYETYKMIVEERMEGVKGGSFPEIQI